MTRSLMLRAVGAGCAVALISVLVTAAIAIPFATAKARQQARVGLTEQATLAAEALRGRLQANNPRAAEPIAKRLRARQIEIILIHSGKTDKAGLPKRIVDEVMAGGEVKSTIQYGGKLSMVDGRPVGSGTGVVLVQPVPTGVAGTLLGQLWWALLGGLLAGVAAGALLARQLARPVRSAAAAARRLSAGDRGVRLPESSPVELADLSHALNELATALAASETRQREFLMSVSHELRTPLTTIRGYAEALADGIVDGGSSAAAAEKDSGVRRAGRTLLAESDRLDRMVADLLTLARLEADDFRIEVVRVDVAELVAAAAEAWHPRCEAAGVPLVAEITPGPGGGPLWADTDPSRLRQVVDGIVGNALRIVPAGAPVVLAARFEPHPTGAGLVVAEVRDGGPGLSDADLAVAFQRGALSERYRGIRSVGSGLGLALAARLVARLGGTLEAGHAPEGGARFTARLPATPPS